MLAAEYKTLPRDVQGEVAQLSAVLARDRRAGELAGARRRTWCARSSARSRAPF
jgi:hypothetical protein